MHAVFQQGYPFYPYMSENRQMEPPPGPFQPQFGPGPGVQGPGVPGFPLFSLERRVRQLENQTERLTREVNRLERRVSRLESGRYA